MADFKLRAIMEYVDQTSAGVKKTQAGLDGLGGAVDALQGSMVVMGAVAAGKLVVELAQTGAQSLRTKQAFDAISGGADTAAMNLEAMQTATRGALSEQQAMTSANQLMQMGLAGSSQELATVAEMATRLGTAMGRDATASLEEFALLLANQSIPRLDTFGISAGKVRGRITELQAQTVGLSREQAFMTAVMEEGAVAMDRLGPPVDDAALSFERAQATAADLKAEVGERLAPAVAGLTQTILLLLTASDQIAEALDLQKETVLETSSSYEEYVAGTIEALVASGRFDEGLAKNATQGLLTADTNRELAATLDLLSMSEFEAMQAGQQWAESMERVDGKLLQTQETTDVTTESLNALSTAASTVAKSFGEMEFDNQSLWDMALASGASIDALGTLATQLGIATDAEIQASLGGFRLTEAFGAGLISAEEYAAGMANVQNEMFAAGVAATDMTAEMEPSAASLDQAAGAASRLAGEAEGSASAMKVTADAAGQVETGLDGVAGTGDEASSSLDGVEGAARRAQEALAAIERDINIRINFTEGQRPSGVTGGVQELQHGTVSAPGGLALVGEAGPEVVMVPRGGQVFTTADLRNALAGGGNTFGGDTIIINDRLAGAMFLDDRRRRQEDRFNARM